MRAGCAGILQRRRKLNQPPYGPEDLKEPPLPGPEFIKLLQQQRVEKCPEPPPFYQALFNGTLKPEFLQLWVKNLYRYWDHTMCYSLSAIMVKTNEEKTRTNMLRKLVCIDGREVVNDLVGWTTPAYEELWLRLGEGLGLAREEVTSWKTYTRSYLAMSTLCLCSRWWEWTWLDGVASLYATDVLGRELMSRAHEALKQHHGVADAHLDFFRAYVSDVTEDIPWEEETLSYWACTTERQLTAARAFRLRLDIEYQLVLPLHHVASGERVPLQVP